eukprot:s3053_g9.t2
MVAPIPRAVASGDFLSDRQYSKDPDPLVAQSCEVALATIDWKHELLQVLKTVRIPEQAYLPDLSVFFNRFNISAEFYATQWFLTLFAYSLPFPQLLRVWDNFLCRGMKNGNIYGIPAAAESVLKIVPRTKQVSAIGCVPSGKWKWHGAAIGRDGAIYCIPANADRVLRIDPETDRVETVGDPLPGRWKWYGGILAEDGCIYGIPYSAGSVLKIEPATGKVSTIGDLEEGDWKWHGGSLGLDGGPFPGRYKWLGAVLGSDGCLYGIPYNSQKILKITPNSEDVELIDVPLKGRNMWQGGVQGPDGAVYFIPRWAEHVLRVSADGATVEPVSGEALVGWNKFQGAVLARNGCIYGVPQDLDAVLKIQPDRLDQFIHRVGLALLKEAKSDLLGQNFDGAIERLRFLCQRSQLSPEALVSLAMEFKVTNRFLSDLEQAITSPSPGGSSRLPCCFLERDLDRGRTQCRFLMNKDGPDAPSVADADGDTFWEASLPAPRVPQDPLAPPIPSTEPPKEKLKAKSQLKSFAKKSQQVLSKVKAPAVLSRSSGNKHSKGQAPTDSILHLSDSERVKENSHPSRSSSVPSRGYQRCGASDAPSAWDASKAPEKAAASRRWMASLRSGRRLRPPSPRLSSRK